MSVVNFDDNGSEKLILGRADAVHEALPGIAGGVVRMGAAFATPIKMDTR